MFKPLFMLPALLLFGPSPQQPAVTPAQVIPAEAVHMTNPVTPTAESQAHAKKVYTYDCAMCHGPSGNGKGDLVADMKLKVTDFTDPATLKDLTDGEIFYIIKNGRGQMPSEGDRAKPDDVWNLVILVRSFSKNSAQPAAASH